jgi:hypothetical protein
LASQATLRPPAGPPAAGGQFAGASPHAVHQRRLRGPTDPHPHFALRETAVKGTKNFKHSIAE